mmetsp:Transcript_87296/g.154699  ORF Transcript_87296/g.154699 Transcript_87296/m.154699 type:complete len:1299 (-) Transcript_87296:285-4181(-)
MNAGGTGAVEPELVPQCPVITVIAPGKPRRMASSPVQQGLRGGASISLPDPGALSPQQKIAAQRSSSLGDVRRIYGPPPVIVAEHHLVWTHQHRPKSANKTERSTSVTLHPHALYWEGTRFCACGEPRFQRESARVGFYFPPCRFCGRGRSPSPKPSPSPSTSPSPCRSRCSLLSPDLPHVSNCPSRLSSPSPSAGSQPSALLEALQIRACDGRHKQTSNAKRAAQPLTRPQSAQQSWVRRPKSSTRQQSSKAVEKKSSSDPVLSDAETSCDFPPGWDPNALARSIHPLPESNSPSPKSNRKLRRQNTCQSEASAAWLGGTRSLSAASGLGALAEACPRSPEEVLALQEVPTQGFTIAELALMKRAFQRFTGPDTAELDRSALLDVFVHLGYLGPMPVLAASVDRLSEQVSSYSNFSFSDLVDLAERLCAEETLRLRAAFESAVRCRGENLADSELPELLQNFGFQPLNRTVREILDSLREPEDDWDLDDEDEEPKNTEVKDSDFNFFNRFLASYRAAEGFNRESLNYVCSTFEAAAKVSNGIAAVSPEGEGNAEEKPLTLLRPELLLGALLRVYGRQAEPPARALLKKAGIPIREGRRSRRLEQERQKQWEWQVQRMPQQAVVVGFTLADFIIWSRRLRELRLLPLWQRFSRTALAEAAGAIASEISHGLRLPVAKLGEVMQGSRDQELPSTPQSVTILSKGKPLSAAEADASVACAATMPSMTLSKEAMNDFIARAGLEDDLESLDFDDFVRFAQSCLRRCGFSTSEAEELRRLFNRFDHDNSGELEPSEFLDLLRYLGHDASLEDVFRFIDSVDCDRNGSLDFQEFLRQMRLHKEAEWHRIRKVFRESLVDRKITGIGKDSELLLDGGVDKLPALQLREAFLALGVLPEGEEDLLQELLKEAGQPQALDLPEFAELAEKCRIEAAANLRRHAGFTGAQLVIIRRLFEVHRKSEAEGLGLGELLWFLKHVGVTVDTLEARKDIMQLLEMSRTAASQTGMSPEDIGQPGSLLTPFWAVVHLLRALREQFEGSSAKAERRIIDKVRFSTPEVADFRQIFMSWAQQHSATPRGQAEKVSARVDEAIAVSDATGEPLPKPVANIFASKVAKLIGVSGSRSVPFLTTFELRGLLRSLGLMLAQQQREELNTKVQEIVAHEDIQNLEEVEEEPPSEEPLPKFDCSRLMKSAPQKVGMHFSDFLCLMRWMLDTNFADISGIAEQKVKLEQKQQADMAHATKLKVQKKMRTVVKAAVSLSEQKGLSNSEVSEGLGSTSSWPLKVQRGGEIMAMSTDNISEVVVS